MANFANKNVVIMILAVASSIMVMLKKDYGRSRRGNDGRKQG